MPEPTAARGSSRSDYPPSWDRIYPRCPVCRREQWSLAVLAFSAGEIPCACGHVIREDARLVYADDPPAKAVSEHG